MHISRYEREQERMAGPRGARFVVKAYAIAAAVGLLAGIVWVITGLLHLHRLW